MICIACKEETDEIYSNGICEHCVATIYADLEGERYRDENYQKGQTAQTSSVVPIVAGLLLLLIALFVLYSLFARG